MAATTRTRKRATGIRKRHTKACPARNRQQKSRARCRCDGGYEAWVYSPRDGRQVSKTFPRESEAKSWRADAKRGVDHGTLRAPSLRTVREAADAWIEGAESGEVLNRSGDPFKPSTLRGYSRDLNERIIPAIGSMRLSAVTTADLQPLVDRWRKEGASGSSVRNAIKPLQAIYRRGRSREGLATNPTHDLELPSPRTDEVQIVSADVAARLLAAIDSVHDRALWGTALYAGLRFGELRALKWKRVDFAADKIAVRKSWDQNEGLIDPKTATSKRNLPMPRVLCELLRELYRQQEKPDPDSLVFGSDGVAPFHATSLYRRADRAWEAAKISARLRLHKARHTYASFMIAAGLNAKAITTFMGHSSIKITFDTYGHLMPGAEAEGRGLLDDYLDGGGAV